MGLRVPKALGDYLILKVIGESSGYAVAVSDKDILDSMKVLARKFGILVSPESAATFVALPRLIENGIVDHNDKVLLFFTGSGFTMPEYWPTNRHQPLIFFRVG